MFLELGCGFFAYGQRLRLLAASLRLLVADVLYTWTVAKPDQAETVKWLRKNRSVLFCHLLTLKIVALCGIEANLSGVNVSREMRAHKECLTA